jgi:hypothetical protein
VPPLALAQLGFGHPAATRGVDEPVVLRPELFFEVPSSLHGEHGQDQDGDDDDGSNHDQNGCHQSSSLRRGEGARAGGDQTRT